jgi:hypothetical protein
MLGGGFCGLGRLGIRPGGVCGFPGLKIQTWGTQLFWLVRPVPSAEASLLITEVPSVVLH